MIFSTTNWSKECECGSEPDHKDGANSRKKSMQNMARRITLSLEKVPSTQFKQILSSCLLCSRLWGEKMCTLLIFAPVRASTAIMEHVDNEGYKRGLMRKTVPTELTAHVTDEGHRQCQKRVPAGHRLLPPISPFNPVRTLYILLNRRIKLVLLTPYA